MRSNKWVAREPHELQRDVPFLSVMVAIAWANRPAKNVDFFWGLVVKTWE